MSTSGENRKRITKRVVDALTPKQIVWDSEVRGYGVRRQAAKKVYLLKARVHGRQRWFTIGEHGAPWTPDNARKEAQRLWGLIREGRDPARERDASRHRPTMADLCDRFLEEYAEQHKKPSSVRMDRKNIENHVLPILGKIAVADVSRADIDSFKRAVREGKTASAANAKSTHPGGAKVTGGTGVANRCLALLSKMFNLAERWGLRPDGTNPVRHIERYREGRRERFLSAEELARLGAALDQSEHDAKDSLFVIAALRLLIFTGARLGEILGLRWVDVDLSQRTLELPDSKTGAKRIYLNPPAAEVLADLPRVEGNPYVIVGHRRGRHLVNIQKPWQRIRAQALLQDVRIHDLRHSYASIAVSSGLTLPLIGKLLGHTKFVTTERYAHLADDPLRAANDLVGQRIGEAFRSTITSDYEATAEG